MFILMDVEASFVGWLAGSWPVREFKFPASQLAHVGEKMQKIVQENFHFARDSRKAFEVFLNDDVLDLTKEGTVQDHARAPGSVVVELDEPRRPVPLREVRQVFREDVRVEVDLQDAPPAGTVTISISVLPSGCGTGREIWP